MADYQRRNALKALSAIAPAAWAKPIVDSVVLPAHAQSSPCGSLFRRVERTCDDTTTELVIETFVFSLIDEGECAVLVGPDVVGQNPPFGDNEIQIEIRTFSEGVSMLFRELQGSFFGQRLICESPGPEVGDIRTLARTSSPSGTPYTLSYATSKTVDTIFAEFTVTRDEE